jgi:REP element-mobilizing transposase RayT
MSFTSTCHHIAFATKGRRRFLCDDVLPRTIEYIGGIIRRLDGQLLAGGGIPDHVHLVAVVPPTISLAEFVKKIKANSSRWIHQTFAQL